ncbi:MAG: hypothetical protein JSS02_12760 [Planctomycetes bacterium]|nr:hypothetical protein [Planctomycetota bacterium]
MNRSATPLTAKSPLFDLRRVPGVLAGLAVHGVFALMVWYLYWFLKGGQIGNNTTGLWLDAGLALQFVVVHSLLLYPTIRERLSTWISPGFYGLFYCLMTTIGLGLTIAFWQTTSDVLWQFDGLAKQAIDLAFLGSWVGLFYSFYLNGIGFQTGLTPWWHWLRGQPIPSRPFRPRSLFRILRHPAYLSFLGLIWFTPVMTTDRAVLTVVWTVYVFIGSYLKDRRLLHYIGTPYREYMAQVPGYPGILFGPLGKVRHPAG